MEERVHRAVIPAAGYGTRFLPATKAQPKETLPVVDRPAFQYAVEEAVRAGIDDILVVTGRNKRAIEDHFDRNPELERALRRSGKYLELEEIIRLAQLAQIHYVRQAEQLGLGHAVLQAQDHVARDPFVVMLGDDIIDPNEKFLERMLDVFDRTQRPVVAVMPVPPERVHMYGVVATRGPAEDGVYEVHDLIEKPALADAPSDLAVIGRYVLTPQVMRELERTGPGAGGEIQLTDALRAVARREPVVAVELTAARYDVGDKQGFLEATVRLAAGRPDLGPGFVRWLRAFVAGLPD